MNIGWVKLHRQFKDWEWYNKSEMVHLFIHCLIKANFKDGSFQGIECKKGSFITSLKHLSDETNISIQTIRTCLKKLQLTKEIEVKSTNKLTQITICNYDSYQQENEDTNKQLTSNQQTTNKQLTTIEEYKESKEENNNKFDFKKSLLSFGFNSGLVSDWLKVRKKKNLTNSEVAYKDFIKQVELNGNDKNYILEQCVIKSWGGFKSEWLSKQNNFNHINNDVLFVTPEGIEIKDKLALHVYKQTGKV